MCVTLLTERDDGRYVNVPATGRDDDRYVTFLAIARNDDRYVTFLQPNETTISSIPRNDRTSFQIISMTLKCSVKCDAYNSKQQSNLFYGFTFVKYMLCHKRTLCVRVQVTTKPSLAR